MAEQEQSPQEEADLLARVFQKDVRELVTEFIDEFDLRYEKKDEGLSDPLLRWLDFTSRYINLRPRRVLYSKEVAKSIQPENRAGFKKLVRVIKNGGDLNPYQSKGLTIHNDISGKSNQKRTDQLWAHWRIHHLHLSATRPAKDSYFSKRSSWLLFCIVGEEYVGIVDVRHHDEQNLFCDPELIKTVVRNWPEVMEQHRLKNVIDVSGADRSASEIATSRKATLNTPIEVDGKFYFAPGGITTAFTPISLTDGFLRIDRTLEQLASELSDPRSLWRKAFTENNENELELRIGLHAKGLCIHDKASERLTLLPAPSATLSDPYARLHHMLLPRWAHSFLIRKNPKH